MRRKDREITDVDAMEEMLSRCQICHIALMDGDAPYVVPMSPGYARNGDAFTLYFHCAKEGKKLDLMRSNPNAAFSMVCDYEIVTGETACSYTAHYASLMGHGRLSMVDGEDALLGMRAIMRQCGADANIPIQENVLARTAVLKLSVDSLTGKASK